MGALIRFPCSRTLLDRYHSVVPWFRTIFMYPSHLAYEPAVRIVNLDLTCGTTPDRIRLLQRNKDVKQGLSVVRLLNPPISMPHVSQTLAVRNLDALLLHRSMHARFRLWPVGACHLRPLPRLERQQLVQVKNPNTEPRIPKPCMSKPTACHGSLNKSGANNPKY